MQITISRDNMERRVKVSAVLLITAIFLAIIVGIFVLRATPQATPVPTKELEEDINALNNTIASLKEDIAKYEVELARLDLVRKQLKEELELIIEENDKMDTELTNGSIDANIKFLSDFLSKDDTLGE